MDIQQSADQANTQRYITAIIDGLSCPVNFEPLKEGVSLSPCCHKVQQSVAEELYGMMTNGRCEKANKPCVICNTTVEAYYVDHVIRSLAASLFALHPPENALKDLAENKVNFPERRKFQLPIDFPGVGADFGHYSGSFELCENRPDYPILKITFFSQNWEQSTFQSLRILGYADGFLKVVILFNRKYEDEIKTFLKNNKFSEGCVEQCMIKCTDKEDIQKLSCVLTMHNQLPAEYIENVKLLLDKGYLDNSDFVQVPVDLEKDAVSPVIAIHKKQPRKHFQGQHHRPYLLHGII